MLHPPKIAALASRLSRSIPGPVGRRRRELLGAVLERKAASGAFDLELLHHWLDAALATRGDRALFGLDRRDTHGTPHDPRIR
jgi:hypothetical protein